MIKDESNRYHMDLMKMNIKNVHGVADDPVCPAPFSNTQPGSCRVRTGFSQRELTWVDLINRYPSSRECLAAFVVSSAAEVIAGVKPANLIRIIKRTLPCGRCMHHLWQEHGAGLLKRSSLQVVTLRSDAEGVLLLFYRPELLEKRLAGRTMQSFLQGRGYPQPLTLTAALSHLQNSCRINDSPDEVGMFLGYPCKDVRGFITRKSDPWNGRCLWRVYGPPHRSLRLYQRFCDERRAMNRLLLDGSGPTCLLEAS